MLQWLYRIQPVRSTMLARQFRAELYPYRIALLEQENV
jgi:hypothetical protein